MKKKLIAALLSAAMVVSAVPVFASDAAADEETATESSTESPLAGKKIAYIMYMSSATIFQMWSDSFTATAEKLGMEASTFFCNDNADTWKSTIEQCAQGGYDGLMVSHGGQEYAYDFLSGILEQYPDLKIVTFDTPLKMQMVRLLRLTVLHSSSSRMQDLLNLWFRLSLICIRTKQRQASL